jgi:hypothetical protein
MERRAMTPIVFQTSVVARGEDGTLSIALMAPLPAPHDGLTTCVTLLACSPEAAAALCAGVAGSEEILARE